MKTYNRLINLLLLVIEIYDMIGENMFDRNVYVNLLNNF